MPDVVDRRVATAEQRRRIREVIEWGRRSNSPTWHIERLIINILKEN
jgi:hypothetical protein